MTRSNPRISGGACGSGSYTNLFEGGEPAPARHAYLNRSLDLEPAPRHAPAPAPAPLPLHGESATRLVHYPGAAITMSRVTFSPPSLSIPEVRNGVGAPHAGGGLSASRLRLLHDTTMIDAALDLDEPDPPPHLPPLPPHPPHPHPPAPRAVAAL